MEYSIALDLAIRLRKNCPVDTGALRMSISRVQGTEKEYIITIGNNQGKEINGSSATIVYASITNYAQTLNIHGKPYKNPNYHWVNRTIEDWVAANKLNFTINADEEDEYELNIR